jgi:GNAT superfamily N-acetyltransferase
LQRLHELCLDEDTKIRVPDSKDLANSISDWHLRYRGERFVSFAAFSGERMIGVATSVFLGSLPSKSIVTFVEPNFRHGGVGQRLFNRKIKELIRLGARVVHATANNEGEKRVRAFEHEGKKFEFVPEKRHFVLNL